MLFFENVCAPHVPYRTNEYETKRNERLYVASSALPRICVRVCNRVSVWFGNGLLAWISFVGCPSKTPRHNSLGEQNSAKCETLCQWKRHFHMGQSNVNQHENYQADAPLCVAHSLYAVAHFSSWTPHAPPSTATTTQSTEHRGATHSWSAQKYLTAPTTTFRLVLGIRFLVGCRLTCNQRPSQGLPICLPYTFTKNGSVWRKHIPCIYFAFEWFWCVFTS